jgi:hypothetical protein
VDRSSAVRELPELHAVAIRLRDEGLGDHVIAVALEIEDDQVPMLLQIAESKLSGLMALDDTSLARTERIGRPHVNETGKHKD